MEKSFEDPRAVLRRYGLRPKRSWGQNFLINQGAVQRIAELCVDRPGQTVVEIGAGLGTLTRSLLDRGAQVIAVEREREMCQVLRAELEGEDRFLLCEADAASFDYVAALEGRAGVIAGNLPYQITGLLLRRIADRNLDLVRAVFTIQEEVANRLVAATGSKTRGVLSVMVQAHFLARVVFRLGPTAFYPQPRVRSAVVQIEPRGQAAAESADPRVFERVVRGAFSSRRKKLCNALAGSGFGPAAEVGRLLEQVGIDPGARAERLEVEAFVELSRELVRGGWISPDKNV